MSKPVVAIVGRPNVGKSTLFNVLAGDKISIVKDTPGVTRDRIYADVSWLDNDFTIIDTGGIEPDSGDVILSQMREQAQIAIDTADVILFLTDVRQGLVDADSKVADMLRRSSKPVVLAVNKVDSFEKYMVDVYEFYNLGIGEPVPISAASRLGLGDMLDELVKMTELDLDTIDAIAVAAGPGSFTGLRIGSATAKGLGLALKKPLVEIPTVDALAYNLYDSRALICPIMDARRSQVYTGIYRFQEHKLVTVEAQMAVPMAEMIEKLNARGEEVVFLGDGVPVFGKMIQENLKVPYSFAPAHVNKQRAAAVAALGGIYVKEGKVVTAMEHVPEYLRVSQAERERAQKLQEEKASEKNS